jgi:CBS domain containing-hemolysin-like protein
VSPTTSLRDVLSVLLASRADIAAVTDADGSVRGSISLSAIRDRAAAPA